MLGFETESHYAAQVDFKSSLFQPHLSKCRNHRDALPDLLKNSSITFQVLGVFLF